MPQGITLKITLTQMLSIQVDFKSSDRSRSTDVHIVNIVFKFCISLPLIVLLSQILQ